MAEKSCTACDGNTPALHPDEADFWIEDAKLTWQREDDWLVWSKTCKHFQDALDVTNQIGALAEQEGHHPDITIHGYRNLTLRMQTHAVGGLTENDFILAAKVDRLWGARA